MCRASAFWSLVPIVFLLGLAGCSVAPGNRFTLFPQRETLIPQAKNMRDLNKSSILALPRELEKVAHKPYTVEPGDVLLVQPADLDSPVRLPADQPILPDGTIHLGKYGQVIVAGKTVPEIEGMVKGAIEPQEKKVGAIIVRIVTRVSKVYYVVGEVNAPGSFPLQGRETVLDGILAAGGLTGRASRCNIIVSRPSHPTECRTVLAVNYNKIIQLGDTTTNFQLAPGDRIYVPSRTFWENMTNSCGHPRRPECDPSPQVPCPVPANNIGHAYEEAQPSSLPLPLLEEAPSVKKK